MNKILQIKTKNGSGVAGVKVFIYVGIGELHIIKFLQFYFGEKY